jgi:hypothetical protein
MPGLFGVPEWGQSPVVNAPLPGCDVANSVNDLWFRLGFLSADDMNIDDRWVTIAELYQFGDDAAKFLARISSIYLTYDASVAVVAATAAYPLPASQVFTEGAWLLYAGSPLQLLRLTTVGQLFALDANWPTTSGNPVRLSLDAAGTGNGVLYPVPLSNSTLVQVMQAVPATVAAGASGLPVSPVLQDYFTYCLLGAALGKESDSAKPEVAAHCKERMKLYQAVITHLFGGGRVE